MATSRPFAYNTGSAISGTTQVGSLAVGTPSSGFTSSPQFWNGPDEDLGFVIAQPISGNTQPTPISGVTASLGFNRTTGFSDSEFVSLANRIVNQSYTTALQASTGLTSLGYWNSYTATTLAVNQEYQGGIIGYIFQPGQPRYVSGETHGIIVDINNYGTRTQEGGGTGYTWGCSGTISGLGEVVGSGYTNQQTILAYMNANCPLTLSGSAYNLATGQTTSGYTDWFVPNYIEFNSVVSGTAALNLVNYTGWTFYVSSRQESSTLYRGSVADLSRPPTYIPAGSYNVWKDGSVGGTHNVKLFRYF